MPHFRLEHSSNILEDLNSKEFFSDIHILLNELGPFDIKTMKSRIIPCDKYFVSDGTKDQAFIHLALSMLPGRPADLKKKISLRLLEELKKTFNETFQQKICSFSVEIRELEGDSYSKEISEGKSL